ncbi:MAG TPA: hypothetical protein VME43_18360 [Bryobacteraceae bacterium]|nr:hypothetical protein [Bryobacteraceae bacterium]
MSCLGQRAAARRSVETRAFLASSGTLYHKLHVSHAGYKDGVRVIHKRLPRGAASNSPALPIAP